MPLHGLKPGQVLDLGVTFLMLRPHAEGALHQQAAQLRQVALKIRKKDEQGQFLWFMLEILINFWDLKFKTVNLNLDQTHMDNVGLTLEV